MSEKKLLLIRLLSIIMGMAFFMGVTIYAQEKVPLPDYFFLKALSFTLGIYCGDPNTYVFFQRMFRSSQNNLVNGYWCSRFVVSFSLIFFGLFIIPNLVYEYFLFASIFSFILPVGRVSNSSQLQVIHLYGGFLKVFISITVYILIYFKYFLSSIILFCSAIYSNYIVSLIFHVPFILRDIKHINFYFNRNLFKLEIIECYKSFSVGLPTHLYTSLGGFIYTAIRGVEGLSLYYLCDRLIHGLGATVLSIMSKTSDVISKLSLNYSAYNFRKMSHYAYLYFSIGLIVGILFIVFGRLTLSFFGLYSEIFNWKSFYLIPLSTASLYLSTLFGTQYFMVNHNFKIFTFSCLFATLVFISLLFTTFDSILILVLTECSITIFQVVCFILIANPNIKKYVS